MKPEEFESIYGEKDSFVLPKSRSMPWQMTSCGKVRKMFDYHKRMMIFTSDRVSAFDVVLPSMIHRKGAILQTISEFWMKRLHHVIRNHMVSHEEDRRLRAWLESDLASHMRGYGPFDEEINAILDRVQFVKKATPIMAECVVRGYISGSAWKEYKKTGKVDDLNLPKGLVESQKLPKPVFHPATKAESGDHDENIDYDRFKSIVGKDASFIRRKSIELYKKAASYAKKKGLILADTKFEFGHDDKGKVILIDEALTPDSSRYWDLSQYKPGNTQESFDKQPVRDYLDTLDWDKKYPGPELPEEIVSQTEQRYAELVNRLDIE